MTTYERLEAVQAFVYDKLCKGRSMKCPGRTDAEVAWKEPECYIGFYPRRMKTQDENPNVVPSILVFPVSGAAYNQEEQRFDSYNHIKRPQDLGKSLTVTFVLTVYDPGTRGGTEPLDGEGNGLATLLNWMDELERELMGKHGIGDLIVDDRSITSEMRQESYNITDNRPVMMGFVSCGFNTMAYTAQDEAVRAMLEG